jgi:DNA-binding NarL/FixJ family response regulator
MVRRVTGTARTRVMIVADAEVDRLGVASLLAGCDDIAVVTTTGSVMEALELCGRFAVEVVVIDLFMSAIGGVTATERLVGRYLEVRVVVLADLVDAVSSRSAIQAGASAYLLKSVGKQDLVEVIRGVMRGQSTVSSEFVPYLVDPALHASPGTDLTAREHDVLTVLADGQTNKGIAHRLGLTEGTVRMYVSTILSKLGVTNRTEATVTAIRQGLVELRPESTPPEIR